MTVDWGSFVSKPSHKPLVKGVRVHPVIFLRIWLLICQVVDYDEKDILQGR